MAASKPGSGAPRAQTTRTLVLVHYYCYFFRSSGRRWPRFSAGFLTCVFGLAFAFAFGRATGSLTDPARFRERGTDPSVGPASAAGRFVPCPDTTLAGCARDVRDTSSLAEERWAPRRARNSARSRRAAALVFRRGPWRRV